jgi:hypothetical protein
MSKLTDAYRRDLTAPEKRRFQGACRDEGVDPKDRCPLCRTRRQTREQMFHHCADHGSWERSVLRIACHVCRVVYGVVTPDPRHGQMG